MGNPFVHIELNSTDTAKAKDFYGQLFDWEMKDIPLPGSSPDSGDIYTTIAVGGGTGGGIMKAGGCGDHDASVAVSMATDVTDEEVGGTDGLVAALIHYLTANSRQIYGDPIINCTPSQPDEETARQLSINIASEMQNSFYEVTFRSPNDMFVGYQQREHN